MANGGFWPIGDLRLNGSSGPGHGLDVQRVLFAMT
jgi:hypothetical protein